MVIASGDATRRPRLAVIRGEPADPELPLLVLGPSLGTSARTLWGPCLPYLATAFDVVAWDLPGHGDSAPDGYAFTVGDLAAAVLDALEPVGVARGRPDEPFHYAGDSVGGAVGLQLMLDRPFRIRTAVLLCTGARIGTADVWFERAQLVRAEGTSAVVDGSRQRWFGPGFAEREAGIADALLNALRSVDAADYATTCDALAHFDVRSRLSEITSPVLAVAGSHDVPTPVAALADIADGVRHGRLHVLEGVAHLAPAEAPEQVADLITTWIGEISGA